MTADRRGFAAVETVAALAAALDAGKATSASLTERAIARAEALRRQGGVALTRLWPEEARLAAAAQDRLRAAGTPAASPLAGVPVVVKDNCDVQGDVTQAGAAGFMHNALATADAVGVARLRAVGAIILGKANMPELAFANTGVNPAFGTPDNPAAPGRLVGGSSSGSAAAVADGTVVAALGSDTGGSIRNPAALCGLAGFKPSAGRVPNAGIVPLSRTFDTIGPIARSIGCCAVMDAALAGEAWRPLPALPLAGMHFGVPTTFVLDGLDAEVGFAFEQALHRLSKAGAHITEFDWPLIDGNVWRGFFPVITHTDAYADHGRFIAEHPDALAPEVARIIMSGRDDDALSLAGALALQRRVAREAHETMWRFNAILMPTVPIVAPFLSALDDQAEADRIEYMIGRNNEIANFFDCCAATIPCQEPGDLPVGLMVMAASGNDRRVLATSLAVEDELARR